jgi:hypothetical protein
MWYFCSAPVARSVNSLILCVVGDAAWVGRYCTLNFEVLSVAFIVIGWVVIILQVKHKTRILLFRVLAPDQKSLVLLFDTLEEEGIMLLLLLMLLIEL